MTCTRPEKHRFGDEAFTLVELLIVMIIIGVLSAIAVPIFLRQRQAAHDSGVKADVTNLGKEIATFFVGGTRGLVLTTPVPGQISITDGFSTTYARLTVGSVPPTLGASSGLDQPVGWCVALTDPLGAQQTYKYSAQNGLEPGSCL